MTKCRKLVHVSLSRLNESLATLGDESMHEFGFLAKASGRSARDCLLALDEKYDAVDGGDEKVGVEEVKVGMEKANKLIVNSITLLRKRGAILFDFYNPFYEHDY